MKKEIYEEARRKALSFYQKAHIVLTPKQEAGLEVADFGLNELESTGLELVVYVNTDRCCAKEMVLFSRQPARSTVMRRYPKFNMRERKRPSAAGTVRSIFMWRASLSKIRHAAPRRGARLIIPFGMKLS